MWKKKYTVNTFQMHCTPTTAERVCARLHTHKKKYIHRNLACFLLWPVSCLLVSSFCLSIPCCSGQVPFGPMAFMPGKLVHSNEVTVLLGDNWFAKCSAKQAEKIVDHRMKCESPFKSCDAPTVQRRWHVCV